MSCILPKYVVLSLFRRNISQSSFNAINIRNGASWWIHQNSNTRYFHYNINKLSLEYFRPKNVDIRTYSVHLNASYISIKDESRELMAVWPDILRDLTTANRHNDMSDVTKWLAKVLQYNVPSGGKHRALMVVQAYKSFVPPDQLTEENLRLARILGWCTELLQAFFLVTDDIEDHAVMRRNQPCWYLCNDIGLTAINDSIMIEMCLYELLKKYFKTKECYLDLIEQFLSATFKTEMGQCLDLLSTNFGNKPNLRLFTMDRYNSLVKYKTAYYTFVLPVTLAMSFAGIKDPEMYRQAKTILLEMGHLFQVRDDYLDSYGDVESTGKVGTDIPEGKCSWLITVALQRATPEQRKVLEECYGDSDPEKINRVKQLYQEIGIPNTFAIYEEETHNLLNTHIQQISRGLPHDFFLKTLNRTCSKIGRKD
ncbi:farnesyl pyrophosphate synthase isoform X1 [Frieseomelitta varia]|uniref:farnesyl pyrophosphate synthase isoform X1 n=1 Tax=Frieseomelitta varia TaxID=561572 RepID=UPI001CB6A751|nr:farnesyl pyrophosphate synthase isoform X1 [Frieseomelitta varia]